MRHLCGRSTDPCRRANAAHDLLGETPRARILQYELQKAVAVHVRNRGIEMGNLGFWVEEAHLRLEFRRQPQFIGLSR